MENAKLNDVRGFVETHTWFHTIDLGDGLITPGRKRKEILDAESQEIFRHLNLNGSSVLDIGAWNGYYTVEANKRGAAKLLAVDYYTWLSPFFRGKETFDFVMKRLEINVETRIIDVEKIDRSNVGTWDVVLFLGVFYHLIDPIAAIMRLGSIAREALVIETWLDLRDYNRPAMVFYPGQELANDPTNWWGPNRAAVEALLRVAGFGQIEFTVNPAPGHQNRGIFHAYKTDAASAKHFAGTR